MSHFRRLPDEEGRVRSVNRELQVFLNGKTKRYHIRFRGVDIFTFSVSDFRSGYCLHKLKEHFYNLRNDEYRKRYKQLEESEQKAEEKQKEDFKERMAYAANEVYKYGVCGSQAPGSRSIVVP